MAQPPTTALATSFSWVTNPSGYDFTITYATVTTGFNLQSGNYMMFMGPSTATGVLPPDALITILGMLNVFYAGFPGFNAPVPMDPVTGRWLLGATDAFTYATVYAPFGLVIGNLQATANPNEWLSQYPPWFLLLFNSLVGDDWQEETTIAGVTAEDGTVYAISSGITRYTDEVKISLIPIDVTQQVNADTTCSPWFPAAANLPLTGAGTSGAGPVWTVANHLLASLGRVQTLARCNWPDVVASTSAFYDVVTIPPDMSAKPPVKMRFAAWRRFRDWTTKLTRLAAQPVGTRT